MHQDAAPGLGVQVPPEEGPARPAREPQSRPRALGGARRGLGTPGQEGNDKPLPLIKYGRVPCLGSCTAESAAISVDLPASVGLTHACARQEAWRQ